MGASSSGIGMMLMSGLGVQVTRKVSATRCSPNLVILASDKDDFSVFTDSSAEVTRRLGSQDFGFTGDLGFSSEMAVIELPILTEVSPILCRQPWVVQNRFSQIGRASCRERVSPRV